MNWLNPLRELVGVLLPILDHFPLVRAISGFVLVFFLPGFAWTLVFFRGINVIERVALSFGLSIALVTLSILLANRALGLRITGFNSAMVIIFVTTVPATIYGVGWLMRRKRRNADAGKDHPN